MAIFKEHICEFFFNIYRISLDLIYISWTFNLFLWGWQPCISSGYRLGISSGRCIMQRRRVQILFLLYYLFILPSGGVRSCSFTTVNTPLPAVTHCYAEFHPLIMPRAHWKWARPLKTGFYGDLEGWDKEKQGESLRIRAHFLVLPSRPRYLIFYKRNRTYRGGKLMQYSWRLIASDMRYISLFFNKRFGNFWNRKLIRKANWTLTRH